MRHYSLGWNTVMKEVSYQNFMMMNLTSPPHDLGSKEESKGEVKGSVSLFDIGNRLDKGLGV